MKNKIVFLGSEGLGRGDDDLGHVVLANFLRVLAQRAEKPAAVICVNSAVRLTCAGAAAFEAQEHLRELEAQGVSVLSCRTCLEHYGLVDRLVVGEIGGMPQFVELMATHEVIAL